MVLTEGAGRVVNTPGQLFEVSHFDDGASTGYTCRGLATYTRDTEDVDPIEKARRRSLRRRYRTKRRYEGLYWGHKPGPT